MINKNTYLKDSFSYPLTKEELDKVFTYIHITNNDNDVIGNIKVKLETKEIGSIDIYSRNKKKENYSILQKFKRLFIW